MSFGPGEVSAAIPVASPIPGAAASSRVARWFLPVALALAVALRLPALGAGLWYDEIETLVGSVRQPFGTILTTYELQNQHLLYSLGARASILLFGDTPAMLRLPALVFGVLSIWALYRLARRVTSPGEAMVGTAALVVSYHHVWFSQNARGYTGLLLFTLLATNGFHRLVRGETKGWRAAGLYGVWMALAVYTHVTAAFVTAAHALVLIAVTAGAKDRLRAARWPLAAIGLATGFGLVLYAPILPQLFGTLFGPSPHAAATAWQNPLWLLAETVRGLARGLPGGLAAIGLGLLVVVVGLVSFWRQDRVLASLLVLPGLLTGAAVVALGHNLWPRFFFFSAGFGVMIVVRGANRVLQGRARERKGGRARELVAAGVAVAVLAGSALTVPRAWGPKQDFRGAALLVDRSRSPGDAVVTVDLTNYPYTRYLERGWTEVRSADSLARVEATHPRTWVLYTFPIRLAAVQPEIWRRLEVGYDTAAVFPGTVGDGAVVVMVHRAAPEPERGPP